MSTFLSFDRMLRTMSLLLATVLFSTSSIAAPSKDLWPLWDASNDTNSAVIDHAPWAEVLQSYLVTNHPSRINRFRYGDVTDADKALLRGYVGMLESVDPRAYSRAEQKAYWINFYNALTVRVILDDYPVSSIKKTGKGFLSSGPWDDKLVIVAGEALTLNDIEHRILRPIWDDARIHFAVNCASIGCPPLQPEPFTAENTEALLDRSASAFINHPNGVALSEDALVLSKLFDWYQEDFGNNEESMLSWLSAYAAPPLAEKLSSHKGAVKYAYDWNLNEL